MKDISLRTVFKKVVFETFGEVLKSGFIAFAIWAWGLGSVFLFLYSLPYSNNPFFLFDMSEADLVIKGMAIYAMITIFSQTLLGLISFVFTKDWLLAARFFPRTLPAVCVCVYYIAKGKSKEDLKRNHKWILRLSEDINEAEGKEIKAVDYV